MSYTLHKGKCKFSFIQSRLVDILSREITIRTRSKTTFEYTICVCVIRICFSSYCSAFKVFTFHLVLQTCPPAQKTLFSLFNLMQLVCYLVTRTTFFFCIVIEDWSMGVLENAFAFIFLSCNAIYNHIEKVVGFSE